MKVKDLIERLQEVSDEYGEDMDIQICESQYDWDEVLYYIPDPADADRAEEIRL